MNPLHAVPRRFLISRSTALTALLLFGSLSLPATVLAEEAADKAIRIREDDRGTLQIQFEPVKSTFKVGEPLRFNIRGNKRFYLYLYTVDPKTGKSVLLLPNNRQKHNQYEADRTHRVPNPNVEFFGDQAGAEEIVMVASTRYLDIDTGKFSKAGDFLSAPAAEVESEFAAEGIRIRDPETDRQSEDRMIKAMTIEIVENKEPMAAAGNGDEPVEVFIFTPYDRYLVGQKVGITFGADHKGWVHLYTTDPAGGYALLTRQEINGKELNQVTARAEAPAGDHTLLAVYTKTQQFDEKLLDEINQNKGVAKSLRLVGESAVPFAVRRIRIED